MNYLLNEPVSVGFAFDSTRGCVEPTVVVWKGREYSIKKVGLHHRFSRGRTLYHVFSVASGTLFFRLILNTENLHWKLEQISDGLPE